MQILENLLNEMKTQKLKINEQNNTQNKKTNTREEKTKYNGREERCIPLWNLQQ